MRQEDIDEQLIDWELARQRGEEIAPSELMATAGPWQHYLEQRLDVLRQTSWMMDDPAPGPLDPHVSKLVSHAALTIKNSVALHDTPSGIGAHDRFAAGGWGDGDGSARPAGDDLHPDLHPPSAAGLPDHMPQVPGFRYVSRLGKGGFGVVFRALDETLERDVAIKFPLIDGKLERKKYISEARNASRVDVPGIVPIYHVGETNEGTPYVIQKLVEGKSLREILKFGGVLSPSQAAEMFQHICGAMAHAHAQALVHRDLKPENILIDTRGRPWITDFGLSVAEDDPNLPLASVAGTPNFMSPEQIMGKVEWLDGRCDIWALGVMLYQCLTGRLPFHSTNTLDLHEKILNFEPRPIAQRQPHIRGDWDKIFRKCCAKSIAQRYNNGLEMADDLKQLGRTLDASLEKHNAVLQQLSVGDRTIGSQGARSARFLGWSPLRLSPAAALALGTVALVLFVLVLAWWRRGPLTGELLVSQAGHGTHRSIRAALAAATDATSIFIEPGVYRESLVLTRKVTLRGRGPQEKIQIVGQDGPVFTVDSGGQLALYGLSISVDDQTQGVWNAIDVAGGSVLLDDCSVAANQFDCVHLEAEANFVATDCDFHTNVHPAIFAKLAHEIVVRQCRFHIGQGKGDAINTLAGMQVYQSSGSVADCTFSGDSAVGIEWSDTPNPVTIDDCQFQNLSRALIATACSELRIGGHGRARFDNCRTALELTGCGGAIKNCHVDAHGRMDGHGFLIRGLNNPDEPINIEACQIGGARAPMVLSQTSVTATGLTIDGCSDMGVRLLENSFLRLNSSRISHCDAVGLSLEGSRAELQRCTITDNQAAGIVVDGLEDAFQAKSCLIDGNEAGIIVLSGTARLEHTTVQGATTGILLARRHLLSFAATCDAQLSLQAQGGSVQASQHAVQFLSPGSYRLIDCPLSDPHNRPVLDAKLERIDGQDAVIVRVKGPTT